MIETRHIETAELVFDATVAGPETAAAVLMVHGLGALRHFWDNQVPAVAVAITGFGWRRR